MKTLNVTFVYRELNNTSLTYNKTLVDVESDSNDLEIKEQINWHFYNYIDNKNIVEIKPFIIN